MRVLLRFGVSLNALPAILLIRTFDGRILFYDRILSAKNLYRLCVNTKNLIITVRPLDPCLKESSRFVKLVCGCNRLSFYFDFEKVPVIEEKQTFYLNDQVYGMPVPTAYMCFYRIFS